jgi:hypothetical protein
MEEEKNIQGEIPLKETDYLRYKGNNVPRVIRLAWTLIIVFSIYYLAKYMWPAF